MSHLFSSEQERKDFLFQLLKENNVPDCLFPFDWLCETDFFRAPASKGHHSAYPGGLFDHCLSVTELLLDWREKLVTVPWMRPESPILVGMLHDVTKINLYTPDETSEQLRYVINPMYSSISTIHGMDSMMKAGLHCDLTIEEQLAIRFHMGAYETEAWKDFDEAVRKLPNVLWTHFADMVASKNREAE